MARRCSEPVRKYDRYVSRQHFQRPTRAFSLSDRWSGPEIRPEGLTVDTLAIRWSPSSLSSCDDASHGDNYYGARRSMTPGSCRNGESAAISGIIRGVDFMIAWYERLTPI